MDSRKPILRRTPQPLNGWTGLVKERVRRGDSGCGVVEMDEPLADLLGLPDVLLRSPYVAGLGPQKVRALVRSPPRSSGCSRRYRSMSVEASSSRSRWSVPGDVIVPERRVDIRRDAFEDRQRLCILPLMHQCHPDALLCEPVGRVDAQGLMG
jgi:hypothetical protein